MASPHRTCSADACNSPVKAKGLCNRHYIAWRRENPASGTKHGEPHRYYENVVMHHNSDECLFWPYGRTKDGYGMIVVDGARIYVHRRVCELANGPAPSPVHHAAHSCGQGDKGCVARSHLTWKLPIGNVADRTIHGTDNRGERCGKARLTTDQVRQIRALKGRQLQREIAVIFGVTESTIGDIQSRRSWSWLDD